MPVVRHRFPKSARLASASEFSRVKEEGQSCHGRFMVLNVLRDSPTPETRVGLITSRRVGSAVERNRARRKLREIIRHSRPSLLPSLWLVLIARRGAADAPLQTLQREWLQLAQRASILSALS